MKANALWLLPYLSILAFIRACVSVWMLNMVVKRLSGAQSFVCYSLISADMQPKQADMKTERKASLCSPACSLS